MLKIRDDIEFTAALILIAYKKSFVPRNIYWSYYISV